MTVRMRHSSFPLEIWLHIVDYCLAWELEESQILLQQNSTSSIYALLLTNYTFYCYLIQHPLFHRLRLWRMLGRIPHQYEPVCIAVATPTDWTLLNLELRSERVYENEEETFLMLQEVEHYQRRRSRRRADTLSKADKDVVSPTWIRRDMAIYGAQNKVIPLFCFHSCVQDLCRFAVVNRMSIWLLKQSARFFRGDNIKMLTNQNLFRCVLESQRYALMVWDRPNDEKRRFTEDVLRHNVELFGNMSTPMLFII
ncbi:uncharacterized protein BYT42DRAFT_563355 [Radiomyces spectabilis]|uniref:uncharacterized protein n=1 Tax=Radiomyces spectabilis TaxID=64574 RepID=UPI002220BD58|nr:uncharacterized protein BYT42DRAFT_563355 [Radiomyces spectabilis]KAI8384696.1 hypothetical protein BYT42DRAFT_563355 [Radiomyces spectabilis]